MPYVRRDNQGTVKGVFNRSNPSAMEFISDKDQEVVAYLNPPPEAPTPRAEKVQESIDKDAFSDGLVDFLAAKFSITRAEVIADIKSRV